MRKGKASKGKTLPVVDIEAGCKYTGDAASTKVFSVVNTGITTQGLMRIYPGSPTLVLPRNFSGRRK